MPGTVHRVQGTSYTDQGNGSAIQIAQIKAVLLDLQLIEKSKTGLENPSSLMIVLAGEDSGIPGSKGVSACEMMYVKIYITVVLILADS